MKYCLVAIAAFLFQVSEARAFSEMARIGYQNCMACHVSPSGGGVLTPYGRGMASDILSTWHYEGEETIGHGLFKNADGTPYQTPEWLAVGGDDRWIQTYVDNLQATQKMWFPMQQEIETAFHVAKMWFVGNLNFEGGPPGTPGYGNIQSNRLYAMYNPTDETYVRAGKFMMPFGINQPNHTAVISQGLGFKAEGETDNVEAGYVGEKFNAVLTGNFGRPDNTDLNGTETGVALNLAYNLLTDHKLGWSSFYGNLPDSNRFLTGPYAIVSFWRKLVWLSQFDFQWKSMKDPAAGPNTQAFVTFNRVQYEVYKGIQPYFVHQINYADVSTANSRYDSYGAGLMFFPRPHFEIWAEWDKERNLTVGDAYTDTGWVILHYYL